MKRLAALLTLLALCVAIDAAATPRFTQLLRATNGSIIVPVEWDGVWSIVDSTYDCTGELKLVTAGFDTICGGQVFSLASSDNPYPLDCSGSAGPTTLDATCAGGATIAPDCAFEIATEVHAVRTGNSYRAVTVWNESYVGSGLGCNLLPGSCERSVRLGTRIAAGPAEYCLTSTRRATWGRLKLLYR